jgi:hypothetical protein
LQVSFFANNQNIMPVLERPECNSSAAACLDVMDKPLIIYNIDVLNRALKDKVTAVAIPSHIKRAFGLINEHYKNINIKEVNDDAPINYTNNNSYGIIDWSDESIRLPINSVIRSLPTGLDTNIALVTEKSKLRALFPSIRLN